MLGVGEYQPLPSALRSMIALVKQEFPTWPVSEDVPGTKPSKFIVVTRAGGTDHDGVYSEPVFIFQVYGPDSGTCEDMCEQLLAMLRSAQFTRRGPVQWRKWIVAGTPQPFPDPAFSVPRRWQFTGSFGLNNYQKG